MHCAERVVEADDRVELDSEGLGVRLGLLDLVDGRWPGHERPRRAGGESDGELLQWGVDGDECCGVTGARRRWVAMMRDSSRSAAV